MSRFLLGLMTTLLMLLTGILLLGLTQSPVLWLAQQAQQRYPQLTIAQMEGSLFTGVTAQQVSWRTDELAVTLVRPTIQWQLWQLFSARLVIDELSAHRVQIATSGPERSEPIKLPSVSLPMPWRIQRLAIAQLQVNEQPILHELTVSLSGYLAQLQLRELRVRYADAHVRNTELSLDMHGLWPIQASGQLHWRESEWPIQISGHFAELSLRTQGQPSWPVSLRLTANVLDKTLPYSAAITLLKPMPIAMLRLRAGTITAKGELSRGDIHLSVELDEQGQIAKPKANVTAWLSMQANLQYARRDQAWLLSATAAGQHAQRPLTLSLNMSSADLAKTLLQLRSGADVLRVSGWPSPQSVMRMEGHIAALSRWLPGSDGQLSWQADWRGRMQPSVGEIGQANIRVSAQDLGWGTQRLADTLQLSLNGGRRHALNVSWQRGPQASVLALDGEWQPNAQSKQNWQGHLRQWDVLVSGSVWRLQAATPLSWLQQRWAMQPLCMSQERSGLAPWLLCADVEDMPNQWQLALTANLSDMGRAQASFQRPKNSIGSMLDGRLQWQLPDIGLLPLPLPSGLAIKGQSSGAVQLSGELTQPIITGQWQLQDGQLQWPLYGIAWAQMQAQGEIDQQRTQWQGSWRDHDQGELQWYGAAEWGEQWQLLSRVYGHGLQLRYVPWFSGRVNPDVSLQVTPEVVYVRGGVDVGPATLRLEKGQSHWRKPSGDVVIIRNRQGDVPAPSVLSRLNTDVAVQLRLTDTVSVGGYGVNAKLQGGLTVRQMKAQPWQADGNIRLVEGAKVEAFGVQLQLVQGRFVFAGPLLSPEILVDAVREVDGIKAGVRIQGRPPSPTVALYADSPMSQQDMLSYLLLGKAASDVGSQPMTATDQQAMALGAALKLSGKTGVLESLGGLVGIQGLSLDTQGSHDKTEVAITGRLSPKLWLSYGRGVFQPTQSVTARYQINNRLSLEAYSALESAITLFYSWRF